jgi:hypothetical protein
MYPTPTSSLNEIVSAALVKYTKLTGNDLVNDPLAAKITPDTIYPVLRQHAQTFHDHPKLISCLEAIVDDLQALSTTPALSEVPGIQVVSPRERIASITTLRCFVL